jgi:RNA polymerase sigma-70 factor (ECF subfamily)
MRRQQAHEGLDSDFLVRLRARSRAAHEVLYRGFSRRVAAYLAVVVHDLDAVSDLTQDVFVKAFEGAAGFRGDAAAVAPWLLVIARNVATDHLRKHARIRSEEPAVLERRREGAAGDSPAWGTSPAIHALVDRLPRDQQRVLVLRYRGSMTVAEIGRLLGKSPDAVRHLEHRALASVRGRIGPSARAA